MYLARIVGKILSVVLMFLLALTIVVHAEGSIEEMVQQGDSYFRARDIDQAIAAYTKAINVDPNLPEVFEKRAIAYYFFKKDFDSALSDLSKSIELGTTSSGVYYLRGNILTMRGKDDQAIRDFTKAIEYKSDVAKAYSYRGMLYARKGKPELAIVDLTKAIELKDDDLYAAYSNRGLVYKTLGQIDFAIADFTKVIQMKPKEVIGYLNRASSYILAGQPLSAVDDYNQILKLRPDLPATYYYLSYALEDANSIDNAIEAVNNYAKAAAPNDPYVGPAQDRLRYLKAMLTTARGNISKLPASTTASDGSTVSSAERQAIITGVLLMEAYKSKDIDKVREINVGARYLPDNQVTNFLAIGKGWTLNVADVLSATGTRMHVRMIYSYEAIKPNTVGQTFAYAETNVTLGYVDGRWRLLNESNWTGLDLFSAMQFVERSTKRYGVNDLSKWEGVSVK